MGGMEGWVKYKLGKGTKGLGGEVNNVQLVELERVLREHSLIDARAHEALKKGMKGEEGGEGGYRLR